MRILGLFALFVLVTATATFAADLQAPELDGGSATTALALLAGSVAVLRARFNR